MVDEVVVSVEAVLLDVVDWSVLAVPLAPMLDVLGVVELLAVLLDELLGLVELYELDGVLLVEPVALFVSAVLFVVDDALVPPEPLEEPELPLLCAIAKPPMASAAAAANVVSVFLVVVMSIAP